MTLFFLSAALLVVLCLAWLLVGLFRNPGDSQDQEAVNITLARERSETLTNALASGAIDQATYDYEREQLDHDLAADLTLTRQSTSNSGGHVTAAIVVAIFVPVAAGALYLKLGNPQAVTQAKTASQGDAENPGTQVATQAQLPGPLADLLPQLEERLETNPDDIEGWRLLGRSYLSIQNYAGAQNAFQQAVDLDETDVATLTQLAESIAMGRNGDLSGDPMAILERAIALNPRNEHTLWLRSIGMQQAGNHQEALLGFNLLMGMAQDNPDAVATIDQMRSRSIQALGANSVTQATRNDDANSEPTTESTSATIEVTVSLNASSLQDSDAEHAVFIYATASNGPPMPLAVTRLTVKDLPATVILDDSMAMIPTMKLSSFDDVTIGARVSESGNPLAQPGDWYTEATNIIISATPALTLVIDTQTP